ncbi:hypothetical protein [Mucilaginibacter psychrotolerans]|uniref:Uncharacterized protein n=1 Tax=Mucilaginibacter psychrotolerans TaxID=1524096 RepID=A0A4Y8SI26_9SPHI|nr:hypothetical protein [Mucilaginibacter psychrotolerans]TFF38753.1 hypothetical protein E2R66_07035 [Mucilaginibacter psychrotolerans]
MIRKAFILAFLGLVAYGVFVKWMAPKWWSATQNTDQQNVTKAENFIYDDTASYRNVIVGSSLSARIVTDSLQDTYNLAMGGQSIYDGLNILKHREHLPRAVLIETNVFMRKENKVFTNALFSPINYYSKKEIPALRKDKQPIAIFSKIILKGVYFSKDKIKEVLHGGRTSKISISAEIKADNEPGDLSTKMTHDTYIESFKLPRQEDVVDSFNNLKSYVSYMQKKNVVIVFFEMPIDTRIQELPLQKFLRTKFLQTFPKSNYKYIPLPNWKHCNTFDGLHLTREDAIKYTAYLKGEIKKNHCLNY